MTARWRLLSGVLLFLACSAGASIGPAMADGTSQVSETFYFEFQERPSQDDLLRLVELAGTEAPVVIRFVSGEWAGEVVLQSDSKRERSSFLAKSLASGRMANGAAVGMQASIPPAEVANTVTLVGEPVAVEPGEALRVPPSEEQRQSVMDEEEKPCPECGAPPLLPVSGKLSTGRHDGQEVTVHQFTGLGPYPIKKEHPDCLDPLTLTIFPRCIVPSYGYEHDYKIMTPDYVDRDADYEWSSTLPGPYRDTRSSDGDMLDFTIGASYTWLFDPAKIYTTETRIQASSGSASGRPSLDRSRRGGVIGV